MKRLFAIALLAIGLHATGFAQCDCPPVEYRDTVLSSTLVDANLNLLPTALNWTCDKLYILDSKVYVGDPANGLFQTLTIEPGTVVKGRFIPDPNTAALIVPRGSKLIADGTADCPIVFTAEGDMMDGTYALCNTAKWGGILMLGRAYNNVLDQDQHGNGDPIGIVDGIGTIEGLYHPDSRHHYGSDITGTYPSQYGGTGSPVPFDDEDDSGILRYVSIRHGGAVIGSANEINGLTLGSVGRGTVLEHIEVVANEDDGIEFFGGTADLKYATLLFNQDDYLDYDQGYKGRVQFVLAVQNPDATNPLGDHGIEGDGDDGYVSTRPANSYPLIYNLTAIGRNKSGDPGYEAKERTEGEAKNCVFVNYRMGVRFSDSVGYRFLNDDFILENNTLVNCAENLHIKAGTMQVADSTAAVAKFSTNNNITETGTGIDFTWSSSGNPNCVLTGSFNAVPFSGSCSSTISAPSDGFFSTAYYRGAFEPGKKPWNTYSLAYDQGYDGSSVPCPSDLDGDNDTDVDDFSIFSNRFGQPCGAY